MSLNPDLNTVLDPRPVVGPTPAVQLPPTGGILRRLFVQDGSTTVPLLAATIEHLEAADDNVLVYSGGRTFVTVGPLSRLVRRLDPRSFLQVHRSHAVNLDQVVSWSTYDGARLRLTLRSGTALLTSRTGARLLRVPGR